MDDTKQFINKLKTKPYLYNQSSKRGQNAKHQANGWKAIAQSLGKQGTAKELELWARHKWTQLKCRFVLERSKAKQGDDCQSPTSSWKHYQRMLYFDKYIPKKRRSCRKRSENADDYDFTLIKSENLPICKVEKLCTEENNVEVDDSLISNKEKSEASIDSNSNNSAMESTLTLYLSEDEDLPLEFENQTMPTTPMNWNCENPVMDSISHFVNFMGDELKSLPSEKRRFVQFEIHKLLMEARDDT